MSNATSVVKTDQPQLKQPIGFSTHGVKLTSFEDAYRFSKCVVESGWAPKGMDKPESVLIALQHGAELGLPPMAALQNIAVINGRPGIYGDAALALVRASGLCESHKEEMIGTEGKDDWGCRVTTKRKDGDVAVDTFTVADAKRAGLWGKTGPWTQYPKRMLRFRARGFSLRDNFGDVLKGLRTVEELQDMPRELNVTPRPTMAQILGHTPDKPAETKPAGEGRGQFGEQATPAGGVVPAEPEVRIYSVEQREQFTKDVEGYILDAGVSEKALRKELEAAGIMLNPELALFEQPTITLGAVAAYCASKAGATTVQDARA